MKLNFSKKIIEFLFKKKTCFLYNFFDFQFFAKIQKIFMELFVDSINLVIDFIKNFLAGETFCG